MALRLCAGAAAILAALAWGPGSAWADDDDEAAPSDEAPVLTAVPGEGSDEVPRTAFEYTLAAGQQVLDHYFVTNNGTELVTVKIFAAATSPDSTDAAAAAELSVLAGSEGNVLPGEAGVDFSDAISALVSLDPGQSSAIPFTIAVPGNATPDVYSTQIVAAILDENGDAAPADIVATALSLTVEGTVQPALTISSMAVTHQAGWNPATGSTHLVLTVTNAGNVPLGASVTASATSWFGMNAGSPVVASVPAVEPGTTREVAIEIPDTAPLGYLDTNVELTPQPQQTLPAEVELRSVVRAQTVVAVPRIALIGVVIIASIALAVSAVRRFTADRPSSRRAPGGSAAPVLADARSVPGAVDGAAS